MHCRDITAEPVVLPLPTTTVLRRHPDCRNDPKKDLQHLPRTQSPCNPLPTACISTAEDPRHSHQAAPQFQFLFLLAPRKPSSDPKDRAAQCWAPHTHSALMLLAVIKYSWNVSARSLFPNPCADPRVGSRAAQPQISLCNAEGSGRITELGRDV